MNSLQQQIEALLPEGYDESYYSEISKLPEKYAGYNQCLSEVKQSLPAIIELVRKDTIERVKEIIKEGWTDAELLDLIENNDKN